MPCLAQIITEYSNVELEHLAFLWGQLIPKGYSMKSVKYSKVFDVVTATSTDDTSESVKPMDRLLLTPKLSLSQLTSRPPHVMAAPHLFVDIQHLLIWRT